ncbi:cytidylyltransferase family protein [Diplocarpon rosae]|nr:cytidylyltransferase family protein [Diplocarpon rosae]
MHISITSITDHSFHPPPDVVLVPAHSTMSLVNCHDPEVMIARFQQALESFRTSKAIFRVIASLPSPQSTPRISGPPPKTVYILDSSFNPPTLAHAHIILSALRASTPSSTPPQVLLLLAIQNADKAAQPATFEKRLAMMQLFADDVLGDISSLFQSDSKTQREQDKVGIDIGLTTLPYFADKYQHISPSEQYPLQETEQVHLIGYDTLVRCFDTKYYPPQYTLGPLQSFLKKHKLRVTYRTDDMWGDKAAQDKFLRDVGEGRKVSVGGLKEWVTDKRIEMVEGKEDSQEVISSTKARAASRNEDNETLARTVTPSVQRFILDHRLYKD